MALPLGKLTILVGAGIVGSVLAKEGRMPSVPDFVSGAFKAVFRQLGRDDSSSSVKKPRNDSLIAQVNSLREELQFLASNRPITIVTKSGKGTGKYGVIIVVVVIGYGYIWWKGWKLPDMMFATTRSLNDARNAIAKQLESVYSSISATRRHLSSKIDGADTRMNEIIDVTTTTHEEVSQLQDKSKMLSTNVQSVRSVVQNLESKINRIEGKQEFTSQGVNLLCDFAQSLENSRSTDRIQASPSSSSGAAIELPPLTPTSRSGSLPPILPIESSPSSDSNGSHKVQGTPRNSVAASGLKDLSFSSSQAAADSNGSRSSEVKSSKASSNTGLFGMLIGGSASLLTRTRSATSTFK